MLAGIKDGDRLIEINNVNVEDKDEKTVKELLAGVKYPNPLVLLVADLATAQYYRNRGERIKSNLPSVRKLQDQGVGRTSTPVTKTGEGSRGLGALKNNPLLPGTEPNGGLQGDRIRSVSQMVLTRERTCRIPLKPDSGFIGLTLNSTESDGTPHRITKILSNSLADNAGKQIRLMLRSHKLVFSL